MKKIIWNSILTTLVATLLLCGVLLLSCACFFPATMMELSYSLGMDSSAMRYAERAYNRFEAAEYAAFAMEIAADNGLYADTERFAEDLLSCADFEAFARKQDVNYAQGGNESNRSQTTYKQYVYVKLCLAQYRLGKGETAADRAASSLKIGEFPQNNALAALLLYALSDGDAAVVSAVSEKINAVEEGALSAADAAYLSEMKRLASSFA